MANPIQLFLETGDGSLSPSQIGDREPSPVSFANQIRYVIILENKMGTQKSRKERLLQ